MSQRTAVSDQSSPSLSATEVGGDVEAPVSSAFTANNSSAPVIVIDDGQDQEKKGLPILNDDEANTEKPEWDEDGVRLVDGVPIVGLKGADDPFSPLNLSTARKWLIVVIISGASLVVTCASSEVAFTYPATEKEFHVSNEVVILGLSLFVFGLGSFPLLVGPLSEFYGRSPIYIISYIFFVAFTFLVAFSNNITAWIFGRFLSGCSGAAFLSVAGGTVSDLFLPHKVSAPMGFYTMAPFAGPIIGPILSGFINQNLHWRWTWYIHIIWAFTFLVLVSVLVPETYLPALLVRRAKELRKKGRTDVRAPLELDQRSIPHVIAMSCVRPFQIMALEPMALILNTWTSLLLGILYMTFTAWSIVYDSYGFNMQCVGLAFLPMGVGILLAGLSHPFWATYYAKVTAKTGRRPPPEEHLRKGIVGAIIVPISLFWFAFTTYPSVHWAVSMVATIPFGIGLIWSFQAVFIFLVDAFRPVAASAMAANSFMRSSFAAGFPLFTRQLFHRLGTQWSLALCAFLTLAMAPFPALFFKYGERLRKGSRFAFKD